MPTILPRLTAAAISLLLCLAAAPACYGAVTQHWKLDDNAASTTVVATIGTNGTLLGGDNTSVKHSTDVPGGVITASLDLNGTDDEVDVSASAINFASGSAWSASAWFKSNNVRVLGKSGGSFNHHISRVTSTQIGVRGSGGQVSFSFPSIPTADWVHVLVTHDASNNLRVWLNGVESTSGAQAFAQSFAPDRIGRGNGNTFHADFLAQVKVFDSDESANVAALYAEGTGLQLHAPFDGDALDASDFGRDGTPSGSPAYTTGRIGQGIDLEAGSSQYVDFGNDVGINSVPTLTFAGWIKPESTPEFATYFSKYLDANNRAEFGAGGVGAGNQTGFLCVMGNGSNSYGYSAASQMSVGTWVHAAMVFDGTFVDGTLAVQNAGRLKLYVNGVQQSLTFSGTIPATAPNISSTPFRTGRAVVMPDGVLDDLRVYNRALTADDVAALHADTGDASYVPVIIQLLGRVDQRSHFDTYGVYALAP